VENPVEVAENFESANQLADDRRPIGTPEDRERVSIMKRSERHDWQTPLRLFDVLNREFGFTVDVAASAENALCKRYFTIAENGLAQPWDGTGRVHESGGAGQRRSAPQEQNRTRGGAELQGGFPKKETCWCNPPYGPDLPRWMRKAYESAAGGATVVCLVPARTHAKWFHAYCPQAEVRFLRGRLRFDNAEHEAPFAQLVIIFRPGPYPGELGRPWVMKPWEWRPRSKQELLEFSA
jgi:hypothetical protein